MARRWRPVLLSLALTSLVGACGFQRGTPGPAVEAGAGGDASRNAERQARARAERQQQAERCLRERPELEAQMASLRRAESDLARVREGTYVPLPAPAPWDEAAESRFRLEDREADWQRHQQAQESWRQQEQSRRARWWADHQDRLREAQARLDQEARALRSRRADLFTGPGSIEFNPTVEAQIRQCQNLRVRPMGKTAPPLGGPEASKSVTMTSQSDTIQ
jgi:hypothetical protein